MKYYPGDIVLITNDGWCRGMTLRVVWVFEHGMLMGLNGKNWDLTASVKDVCLLGRPSGFLADWQRAANDFDRKIGDTITIKRPSMNVIKSGAWIES